MEHMFEVNDIIYRTNLEASLVMGIIIKIDSERYYIKWINKNAIEYIKKAKSHNYRRFQDDLEKASFYNIDHYWSKL